MKETEHMLEGKRKKRLKSGWTAGAAKAFFFFFYLGYTLVLASLLFMCVCFISRALKSHTRLSISSHLNQWLTDK